MQVDIQMYQDVLQVHGIQGCTGCQLMFFTDRGANESVRQVFDDVFLEYFKFRLQKSIYGAKGRGFAWLQRDFMVVEFMVW